MTVGNITDYVCKDRTCSNFISKIGVRHLVLKDTQVLPDDEDLDQEDPAFCVPKPQPGESPRTGACPGADNTPGPNYTGGNWYFTVNGQQYPTIPIRESGGEIWRITNVSGSLTYQLNLRIVAQGRNMLFQVLSMDGVSVKPTKAMTGSQQKELGGNRLFPESCPSTNNVPEFISNPPICTRTLVMLPSSRAEIWVTYRDSNDDLHATPRPGEYAALRSTGYSTGETGDQWPAVDLARVEFPTAADPKMPRALSVNGEAIEMLAPLGISASLASANAAVPKTAPCPALPPGHMRRVFFGIPSGNPDAFGLAYEEVDQNGIVYGPAATDLTPF
ncbi:MAG: copper oxidase, partial [Bryobacterales bacterium]|nr:copper oxidase [Bryobacterales bacterium]